MVITEPTTERISCRRPTPVTKGGYERLLLDPAVERWLRPDPMPGFRPEDPGRLLRHDLDHWAKHGFGPWALVEIETGAFMGRGGLAWTTVAGARAVELPWALIPEFHGRGLATEAALAALATARSLGLEEVVSLTVLENDASRRVMEKIGMDYVGEVQHVGLPHHLFKLRLTGRGTGTTRSARSLKGVRKG